MNKIKKTASEKYTNYFEKHPLYHTLKLPDGTVLKEGYFDMSKYVPYYKIPEDLSGKTVLDIGAANGFFSFEFDRRGAKEVTAMDYIDVFGIEDFNKLMGTNVKFKLQDFNKLDESFGKFDVVFCSHVLQHVSDISGCIKNIKSVTKGMAIICTAITQNDLNYPMAVFSGDKPGDEQVYGEFWKPNIICFKEMALAAGFSRVEEISVVEMETTWKATVMSCIIHCYP